jgi:hypothetical protein
MAGLAVLAVTPDRAFLREVRVTLPLAALEAAGIVEGWRILDPVTGTLSGREGLERFDAVLVQREGPAHALDWLERTGLPFAYDIDDLLGAYASYRDQGRDAASQSFVDRAARLCSRLLISNGRLLAALERRVGVRLAAKAVMAPNLSPFERPPARPPGRPGLVLWTSSDLPALTSSRQAVAGALREFTAARGLPVVLMGRFPPDILAALPGAKLLGPMDYWRHKLFLANLPRSLAAAPLESRADPHTQAFIDCKSDVKMAEYGGAGLAGVYSLAAPHADSDLRAGILAENTRQGWRDALEEAHAAPAGRWDEEARRIAAARAPSVAAPGSWGKALSQARLAAPIDLRHVLRGMGFRSFTTANAGGGYPPHHRLADLAYHGVYLRLLPERVRKAFGRLASQFLCW